MGLIRQFKGIVVEVKPVFSVMESFSTSLEQDTFDYEQHQTELHKLAEQLVHALSQVNLPALGSALEPLIQASLRRLARPSNIARIRAAFRDTGDQALEFAASVLTPGQPEPGPRAPRVQECLVYLDDLHKRVPYATFAIIAHLPVWKFEFISDLFELGYLKRQARNTKGEKRARALKALARHVTEHVHQRYVKGLEFAEFMSKGRKLPKRPNSYGAVINIIKDWDSPAKRLIHPDAARLRNAASHLDRWEVNVKAETLVMHDEQDPSHKLNYTFDELYDECERLSDDAAAFAEALLSHAMKLVGDLIVNTQIPEILLSRLSEQPLPPAVEEEESKKIAALFEPLKARLAAIRPDEKLPE
ncbi:hypothetical protein NR798_45905 [Archangium gephyra]|uniref:hypothetical protein n=1 Tax=Archangium gephyra TaxID=48 RepID=UPI0035D3E667